MKKIDKKYLGKEYLMQGNLKAKVIEDGVENFPYAYISPLKEGNLFIGYYKIQESFGDGKTDLLSADGTILVENVDAALCESLCNARDEKDIEKMKSYSDEMAAKISGFESHLTFYISKEPELIKSVPPFFSKILKNLKKHIVIRYQSQVYHELEFAPAGKDCKEIYDETQKNLEIFKQVFSEWDKAIESSEDYRNKTKELFINFDKENEDE